MNFLFLWDTSADLHTAPGARPGSSQPRAESASPSSTPQGPPRGFAGNFPDFPCWKGLGAAESGFPWVPQPLQQPGDVPRPVCPWAAAPCVPTVLLQECRPCRQGMLSWCTGVPEPSIAQQSCCFCTQNKGEKQTPFWRCKEQPGAQPGPVVSRGR